MGLFTLSFFFFIVILHHRTLSMHIVLTIHPTDSYRCDMIHSLSVWKSLSKQRWAATTKKREKKRNDTIYFVIEIILTKVVWHFQSAIIFHYFGSLRFEIVSISGARSYQDNNVNSPRCNILLEIIQLNFTFARPATTSTPENRIKISFSQSKPPSNSLYSIP